MGYEASQLPALLDDLDRALDELVAPFARDPGAWRRGPAGKWNAGQHVEHIAASLALSADAFERAESALRAGRLPARPWRDPLQALVVRTLTGGRFPRGGRSVASSRPGPAPGRDATLARLRAGAGRHRSLHERLTPEERGRIWVRSPFAPPFLGWHYTLPELVRVHATHTRHHGRLIAGALAA